MRSAARAPLRVALHAINGVGLGHLVRATTIAGEMCALVPDVELLVLTNARDTSMLERAAIDHVAFPPRLAEPHADPDRCRTALPDTLEHAALAAALDAFQPDLVVFDTHAPPALVRYASESGARCVLVLRELRPAALAAFFRSTAATSFDRIVVPHEPGDFEGVALPAGSPIAVVGPVVRPSNGRAARIRGTSPAIVAMAGGGGQPVDARRFVRAVADAHLLVRARVPRLVTTLVVGPYGALPEHVTGFPGLRVVRTADLPALMAHATLVVTQAGYNAVAEVRALRKAAIFVPGHRKSEDQRQRARRLVKLGAARIARPEARSIADAVEAVLTEPGAVASMEQAHARAPLVPKNREVAEALLAPVWAPARQLRKVVLVAHDFPPKRGGMETVALGLARSLLDRGVDVQVFTCARFGDHGFAPDRVHALYRPRVGFERIDLWTDLLLTIDALLADPPDAVHLCNAGLGPWIPALRAALPCIVTVHVHGNDLLAPWVHHGGDPEAHAAARIAGLSAAGAVVCVSRFSTALAREQGVRPEKLRTIENGVDGARFAPGPRDKALAERLGIAADDEVVLTVSRLAPRKGHKTMLAAFASILRSRPRARYVFTGEGALAAEIAEAASQLGVADRVIATGFVSDADLPGLYRLAKVFALLVEEADGNDVEGFGVALLEAAASGLPVVATRSGGIAEAVEDGASGTLVAPSDAPAASRAIIALLHDERAAMAMGARGRARAVAGFSSDRAAERVLGTWSELATESRRPCPSLDAFAEAFVAPGAEAVGRAARVRDALRTAVDGAAIVRLARREAAARRADRAARRAALERIVRRGGVVRLRATGDGARSLPAALEDCASLGHAPEIELKLRRFLDADVLAHAVPRADGVHLVHSVPSSFGAAALARVASLDPAVVAKVRALRLFLSDEAHADGQVALAGVGEAHALRRAFAARGVTVVPPPELTRYLAELPAGGPETAMIEPTNVCNLSCPTCPTGTGKIAPLPAMTVGRFEQALEGLVPRLRNLSLWNYGEPLLNRDLPKLVGAAKAAGVAVVKVSSNVHFLDETRGAALLTSGLDVLILSVDGASQATYATFRKDGDFARVERSVRWICAEKKRRGLDKPRIELQFIAMRHNEHEVGAMRQLAVAWGVDRLRIKTVGVDDEDNRGLVPSDRLLSRYREDKATPNVRHSFCTMAWDHTVVNVDGSVTPCCYLRPDMGSEFVMGNVFETPFLAIWRGEKYRDFRARMLAGRETMPVCDRCRGGTHDLLASIEEVASS